MSSLQAQEPVVKDYRSAMAAAVRLYNSGDLAKSRQPFEAAVELASSEREKNDAYSGLIKVYSETGDFERIDLGAEAGTGSDDAGRSRRQVGDEPDVGDR